MEQGKNELGNSIINNVIREKEFEIAPYYTIGDFTILVNFHHDGDYKQLSDNERFETLRRLLTAYGQMPQLIEYWSGFSGTYIYRKKFQSNDDYIRALDKAILESELRDDYNLFYLSAPTKFKVIPVTLDDYWEDIFRNKMRDSLNSLLCDPIREAFHDKSIDVDTRFDTLDAYTPDEGYFFAGLLFGVLVTRNGRPVVNTPRDLRVLESVCQQTLQLPELEMEIMRGYKLVEINRIIKYKHKGREYHDRHRPLMRVGCYASPSDSRQLKALSQLAFRLAADIRIPFYYEEPYNPS